MPILLFANDAERESFNEYYLELDENEKNVIVRNIEKNAIMQHILAKEERDGVPQIGGVKDIALSYGIYKRWLQIKETL